MRDLALELLALQPKSSWEALVARLWASREGQRRITREWHKDNKLVRNAYLRRYRAARMKDPVYLAKERKRNRDKYHNRKKRKGGKNNG